MSIRNSLLFVYFLPLRAARQVLNKNCITFHLDFCPAGPLGGNFGQKYTIFCPTRPLNGNFDKRFTTFIRIFSNRLSQFFPTQRCTPQTREFQFSQEPALHAAMPQNQGSQFLKSRRFTPQNQREGLSFSQAGASSLKTGEVGSSFSKDGAMRMKTGWALSFKKRFNFPIVSAIAKTGFQFFQSRR